MKKLFLLTAVLLVSSVVCAEDRVSITNMMKIKTDKGTVSIYKFKKSVTDERVIRQLSNYERFTASGGFHTLMGLYAGYRGINAYHDSANRTDNKEIVRIQGNSIMIMIAGGVLLVKGHMDSVRANEYLERAIEIYNEGKTAVQAGLLMDGEKLGISVASRF